MSYVIDMQVYFFKVFPLSPAQILYYEETLDSIPGTVTLTVNPDCASGGEIQITVTFGVTNDIESGCSFVRNGETVNGLREGNVFSTAIRPGPGESYCYMASLSIGGSTVASE